MLFETWVLKVGTFQNVNRSVTQVLLYSTMYLGNTRLQDKIRKTLSALNISIKITCVFPVCYFENTLLSTCVFC